MATKPMPRQQCSTVVHLLDNAFLKNEESAVYTDKKRNYLVTASYQYGLARTIVLPNGTATYIGAGPVETLQPIQGGYGETTRWTKVDFNYISPPDRMLIAAGCAVNQIPQIQLTGEFADTCRLVSSINDYLRRRHGKAAREFAGMP